MQAGPISAQKHRNGNNNSASRFIIELLRYNRIDSRLSMCLHALKTCQHPQKSLI